MLFSYNEMLFFVQSQTIQVWISDFPFSQFPNCTFPIQNEVTFKPATFNHGVVE